MRAGFLFLVVNGGVYPPPRFGSRATLQADTPTCRSGRSASVGSRLGIFNASSAKAESCRRPFARRMPDSIPGGVSCSVGAALNRSLRTPDLSQSEKDAISFEIDGLSDSSRLEITQLDFVMAKLNRPRRIPPTWLAKDAQPANAITGNPRWSRRDLKAHPERILLPISLFRCLSAGEYAITRAPFNALQSPIPLMERKYERVSTGLHPPVGAPRGRTHTVTASSNAETCAVSVCQHRRTGIHVNFRSLLQLTVDQQIRDT
jgi:hypothetical protein